VKEEEISVKKVQKISPAGYEFEGISQTGDIREYIEIIT
jgi:hypothetical protein